MADTALASRAGEQTWTSQTRPRGHSKSHSRKEAPVPLAMPSRPARKALSSQHLGAAEGTPPANGPKSNGYAFNATNGVSSTSNANPLPISSPPQFPILDTVTSGRPNLQGFGSAGGFQTHDVSSTQWSSYFTRKEYVTAFLLPMPFVILPIVWTSTSSTFLANGGYLQTLADASKDQTLQSSTSPNVPNLSLFTVCLLTSGVLLLVGILGEIKRSGKASTKETKTSSQQVMSMGTAKRILGRILSVGLPFYATGKLGGERVATIILTSLATDLMSTRPVSEDLQHGGAFRRVILPKKWTICAIGLQAVADYLGLAQAQSPFQALLGYIALATSILLLPPPYPTTRPKASIITSPLPKKARQTQLLTSPLEATHERMSSGGLHDPRSPLVSTPWDTDLTMASGVLAGFAGVVVLFLSGVDSRRVDNYTIFGGTVVVISAAAALLFAPPRFLRSPSRGGILFGLVFATFFSQLAFDFKAARFWIQCVMAVSSWLCTRADLKSTNPISDTITTDASHQSHSHSHHHHEPHSRFTSLLLRLFANWPLLHSILLEKDSRRIFYFLILNFAFMTVQTFYGYVSKSLGLLSDSVHMFFDCVALLVGLAAAVMSKWPPDARFPYGYGMIDTLAGFANGVFLMLISLEIVYEAIERLFDGAQLQRITELLVVSTLGLAVNLVGMLAFGHAHHGHGHDHGHDHSHGHGSQQNSQEPGHEKHHHDHHHHDDDHHKQHHDHRHDEVRKHKHDNSPHSHAHSHHTHGHSHSHSHGNENMLGIWLHILADTLGSAAVVVSTLLVHYTGWPGFDPLASCLIAILIFGSAIPLVTSTAKRLLLTVPDSTEFDIREAIAGASQLPGVLAITAPRVWVGAGDNGRVQGVMHVSINRSASLEETRRLALEFFQQRDMDVVVQIEREGDTRCWCGGYANQNS